MYLFEKQAGSFFFSHACSKHFSVISQGTVSSEESAFGLGLGLHVAVVGE